MNGETKPTVADIYRRLAETICNLSDRHQAAEELIAVFMEFKFLQEDWKVKAAVEKYKGVK